jgi:phage terminase Nu1 subunit (DNA packaging protein)
MNEPLPATIDGRSLAKLTGYTWRWIQEQAERGIVKKTGRGEFDFAGSIQGIINFLKQKDEPARERLTKAQASREERIDRAEAGEEIKLEVAKSDWSNVVLMFRQRMISVGNNVESKCGLTEAQRKSIEQEISDGLRELEKKMTCKAEEIEQEENERASQTA